MSDLISRSELLKEIEKYKFGVISNDAEREYIKKTILDFIICQPNAYDIDKVVEKLGKNASRYTKKYVTPYGNNGYKDTKAISIRKAIEIVKQEAEQCNNGWIPCCERLPEEELEKAKKERGSEAVFPVLATINKKHVVTGEKYTTVNRAFYGCYNDKNFYNACCDKLDVIAWQPLPEPFKERD